MLNALKKGNGKLREFIRFCIVGMIAAGIHYLVYFFLQLIDDGRVWLGISYAMG